MFSRKTSFILLSAMACAMVATAQTSQTTGAIRGVIRNQSGKALTDAKITNAAWKPGSPAAPAATITATTCCPWCP